MAEAIFEEPRLADIYDAVDGDRSDLDAYVALIDELGADLVLDVGCGTGTFACLLAGNGKKVTGIDPAAASLAVARRKPHAERVSWIEADATSLPSVEVDAVTMTGNVAQVFLTDDEWTSVLRAAYAAIQKRGCLVFEARNPACRAWEHWTKEQTHRRIVVGGAGAVETWAETTSVALPFVTFRHTFVFEADARVLTSDSTLRFRSRTELIESVERAGLGVRDIRDAPDRPGLEFVFIAERSERRPT